MRAWRMQDRACDAIINLVREQETPDGDLNTPPDVHLVS
jgi:hypothetical protein